MDEWGAKSRASSVGNIQMMGAGGKKRRVFNVSPFNLNPTPGSDRWFEWRNAQFASYHRVASKMASTTPHSRVSVTSNNTQSRDDLIREIERLKLERAETEMKLKRAVVDQKEKDERVCNERLIKHLRAHMELDNTHERHSERSPRHSQTCP